MLFITYCPCHGLDISPTQPDHLLEACELHELHDAMCDRPKEAGYAIVQMSAIELADYLKSAQAGLDGILDEDVLICFEQQLEAMTND